MWEKIMEAGIGVHILWGIGVLGLLLKMIANTYLKGLVRASENMATTRKKKLRIIRQKYENGRSLGINTGSGEAFVEKNVRKMKFAAFPLEFWRRIGQALCSVVCMMMAGGFLYYDVSWRGSPDMIYFLANGVLVCAFLLGLENIFLLNNKMEILKANIRDYLENLTGSRDDGGRFPARPYVQRYGKGSYAKAEAKEGLKRSESAATSVCSERLSDREVSESGEPDSSPEMVSQMCKVVKQRQKESESPPKQEVQTRHVRESPPEREELSGQSEEILNSFLKEFFS